METSGVTLNEELDRLTEFLAENSHDTWARTRFDQGWRYGPARDDIRKEHPCLVPYSQLPESEKQYDRAAVLETLKAILALGYQIGPPVRDRPGGSEPLCSTGRAHLGGSRLEDPPQLDLPSLQDTASAAALWHGRSVEQLADSAEFPRRIGEWILRLGEPLLAYDVLTGGLERWPGDVRLRQLMALALARSGAAQAASEVLFQLQREGNLDEETLGLLARTHKDAAEQAAQPEERERWLREAYEVYAKAYQQTRGYWSGINVATIALLLGERDRAVALAREIREHWCRQLRSVDRESDDRYWILATLGEAALILGEWSDAEDWYGQAAGTASRRFGDLSSTRRNARLLMEHIGLIDERIERCLSIPRVVVFAGHMIDRPERPVPRFPLELEGAVSAALRERLEALDAGFGYASAACGSDLLFLEAILGCGGEVHVVLPYAERRFIEDNVDIVRGAGWAVRCESVLRRATDVLTASGQPLATGFLSHDYVGRLLDGLAIIRSEQLDTELVQLAVWDGKPGSSPGGTASTVERWRRLGRKVEVIDLADILRRHGPLKVRGGRPAAALSPAQTSPARRSSAFPVTHTQVIAILFADAADFSALSESEFPNFVQNFLGDIAALVTESSEPPVIKNTWGDGLYLVFSDVGNAGRFALALRDWAAQADWVGKGLTQPLRLRIGLHAGPAYAFTDPVTGQPNYIGTHVSRAARIEPITPPGQVYASQAFAALAAAEAVRDFACDYIGRTPLGKGHGVFPTYCVRRRGQPGRGP